MFSHLRYAHLRDSGQQTFRLSWLLSSFPMCSKNKNNGREVDIFTLLLNCSIGKLAIRKSRDSPVGARPSCAHTADMCDCVFLCPDSGPLS